ncbi:MAG: helix-turn-helix domain-containing protein [Fimbriimonadaceae bacterium]|nr:helix-turn-helix domain-containing protein [Fimbriimonadaceae bacterium]
MKNLMSGPEVAKQLGISERRVRAMIAEGSLPAQRMMGRWVIPTNAVASFRAKSAGRPMAEQSAWSVLRRLAGDPDPMPPRLRHRLDGLAEDAAPAQRLRSWVGNRGESIRLCAFKPALDGLQDDDRIVLSGDRVVDDLEPSGQLRLYANAADIDDVIADHALRRVNGDRLPNAVIWAVSDVDAIPRKPADRHAAAEVVAAIDLLDEGDPRAVGIADRIIERALQRQQA